MSQVDEETQDSEDSKAVDAHLSRRRGHVMHRAGQSGMDEICHFIAGPLALRTWRIQHAQGVAISPGQRRVPEVDDEDHPRAVVAVTAAAGRPS